MKPVPLPAKTLPPPPPVPLSAEPEQQHTITRELPPVPQANLPEANDPAALLSRAIMAGGRRSEEQPKPPTLSHSASKSSLAASSTSSLASENLASQDNDAEPECMKPEETKLEIIKSNSEEKEESLEEAPQQPRQVKAVFMFEGEGDELSFEKGETITLLKEHADGWGFGTVNGLRGVFPMNYVREVDGGSKAKTVEEGTVDAVIDGKEEQETPNEPKKVEPESVKAPAKKAAGPSAMMTLDFGGNDDNKPSITNKEEGNDDITSPKSPQVPANKKAGFSYLPALPPNGQFAFISNNSKKPQTSDAAEQDQPQVQIEAKQGPCGDCGCNDFSANVFKKNKCNNCFHFH